MREFYLKIVFPVIISIGLFVITIFMVIIPRYQQSIMNGKREMIKELTNSAISILSKYENYDNEGVMCREEAQKTAISRIQYLRYGDENKDYFWITDMEPRMIVHPFRPDLNGKNLSSFTDPHGKKMFVEFVETVKKQNEGYVDYMWQWKDDSIHIVPKLSYVEVFKPWQWVIGTGIYIEDVKLEITSLTKRLVSISVSIIILIAFMLFYIFKQSLNVERKRLHAVSDLKESREKYRALVEAAKEGLIMLIDGRISFANNVFLKMMAFVEDDLIGKPFSSIFDRNNNSDTLIALSENNIKNGNYEICLINKNGNLIDVLITSSTTFFYDKDVNILIVKLLSERNEVSFSNVDYKKIIASLDLGVFKVSIGGKGRFVYVNDTVLRILGYTSFESISGVNFIKLFENNSWNNDLINELNTNGIIKNKIVKLIKASGKSVTVKLSMTIISELNADVIICDGIFEDITQYFNNLSIANETISELKSIDLIMEKQVSCLMDEVVNIKYDDSLKKVLEVFKNKKIKCVLLIGKKNEYLGIITNTDIQNRILELGLDIENPAYLIMSSPLATVDGNYTVAKAMLLCEQKGVAFLPVSISGSFVGVFSYRKVLSELKALRSRYFLEVKKCLNVYELKVLHQKVRLIVCSMLNSGIDVHYATNLTADFSDAITSRLIDFAIDELGSPPLEFAFICLGSEGRKEETLLTDQDNAIIYNNVSKTDEAKIKAYFIELGRIVCDNLNEIGYSYCKGQIMASNPNWCCSINDWKNYFNIWINTPEPQNLLDAITFFDLRFVEGSLFLVEELKKSIEETLKQTPSFYYHLALNVLNVKIPQLTTGLLSDKVGESVDIKAIVVPIVMFARAYSLKSNIWLTNTRQRLIQLKNCNVLNDETVNELLFAYNFLMKMRFLQQVKAIEKNSLPTNYLSQQCVTEIEWAILKRLIILINNCQSRIKVDFRVHV